MVKMVRMDAHSTASAAPGQAAFRASTGAADERFEIRCEDENIWMSQKMLAAVYGVEVPNISYHPRKLFADAELDKEAVIKELLTTAADGKTYSVKHYNLDVIIALGFKIDNGRAVQFRKVGQADRFGIHDQGLGDGRPAPQGRLAA